MNGDLAALFGETNVATIAGRAAVTLRRPEDAVALVALARERDFPLHPWNGGDPPGAALPAGAVLVTASPELGGEPLIAADDYYMEVAAAATWADVRMELKSSRLWIPFAAAGAGTMTVGETVARFPANAFAPLYGEFPRLLFGLWFVADDGAVVHTGRRTIKGVAGYDLTKLFLGSRGRAGLVTRVRLRLFARPRNGACWRFPAAADAGGNPPTAICAAAAPGVLWTYAEGTPASLEKAAASYQRLYGDGERVAGGADAAAAFIIGVESAPAVSDTASPVEGPWSNMFV
jgi:FAD/FMN-containing dehydrogenase